MPVHPNPAAVQSGGIQHVRLTPFPPPSRFMQGRNHPFLNLSGESLREKKHSISSMLGRCRIGVRNVARRGAE